jgi:hypothetical protein
VLLVGLVGEAGHEPKVHDAYVDFVEAIGLDVLLWQLVVVANQQVVKLQVVVNITGGVNLLQNRQ